MHVVFKNCYLQVPLSKLPIDPDKTKLYNNFSVDKALNTVEVFMIFCGNWG